MAYEFYVTIEGTKQGKFKGESIREAHKDKIAGLAFRYGVQSPRDVATGQASGKRQHSPVVFIKEWGPATPQLFQACTTNEVLKSVLFEFVRTTADGAEEIYHTIKLTNATVSSLSQRMSEPPEGGGGRRSNQDGKELEEVAMTFQTIEIENKVGKTMAADDWTK